MFRRSDDSRLPKRRIFISLISWPWLTSHRLILALFDLFSMLNISLDISDRSITMFNPALVHRRPREVSKTPRWKISQFKETGDKLEYKKSWISLFWNSRFSISKISVSLATLARAWWPVSSYSLAEVNVLPHPTISAVHLGTLRYLQLEY